MKLSKKEKRTIRIALLMYKEKLEANKNDVLDFISDVEGDEDERFGYAPENKNYALMSGLAVEKLAQNILEAE